MSIYTEQANGGGGGSGLPDPIPSNNVLISNDSGNAIWSDTLIVYDTQDIEITSQAIGSYLLIYSNAGAADAFSGVVSLSSGFAEFSNASSGDIYLSTGAANNLSGGIYIAGGSGGNKGGDIGISAGSCYNANGVAGNIAISAGYSQVTGTGGTVSLHCGTSSGAGKVGGNLNIELGQGINGATNGKLKIRVNELVNPCDANNGQVVTYGALVGPGNAAVQIKAWLPIDVGLGTTWIPIFGV